MTKKQEELKCEQTRKVNAYNATTDPMLDPEAPIPKCCPVGEKCNEAGEQIGKESDTQSGSKGDSDTKGGPNADGESDTEGGSDTDGGSDAENGEEEDEDCSE